MEDNADALRLLECAPSGFQRMRGLPASEFDQMVEVEPHHEATERERLAGPDCLRVPGADLPFELDYQDALKDFLHLPLAPAVTSAGG